MILQKLPKLKKIRIEDLNYEPLKGRATIQQKDCPNLVELNIFAPNLNHNLDR